jgi:hypothetical protein
MGQSAAWLSDDWRDHLARVCAERAEMAMYRKTLDDGIDSINAEIREILSAHDLIEARVPGYQVTMVTTRRGTLSAERLLELGVSTATIAEATKVALIVSVRVTEQSRDSVS